MISKRSLAAILVFLTVSNIVFDGSVRAQSATLGQWSEKTPMPTARKEISNATVLLDGKIYVVGGVASNGSMVNLLEAYDPANNSWDTRAPLPITVWRTIAAAADGKLFVFGGYRSLAGFPFSPTNRVFEYDPVADQWTEKAPLPSARGTGVAVTVDGKIHVLGGAANSALSIHNVYDPQNDSWSNAPSIPTARSGLTASAIDDKIYVAGGYILSGGVVRQNVLQAYDPANQTWSTLSPMPEARTGIAAAAVRGKMYVFGGDPASSVSKSLEYDPVSGTWSQLQDMPSAASFAGVAAFQDTIYVVGGGPVNLNRFDGQRINRAFVPPSSVTSIGREEFLPTGFQLRQNYPNPFNPSTTISFTIDVKQHVTLKVYDLLGRMQSTLVDGVQPAGEHRVLWNGRDSRGLEVANGVYVYQISISGHTQSRKMLVLK